MKVAHQSAKFQTFDFTKLYLVRLLLLKVYKIWCVSWHWKLMQNLKKKSDLLFQNWQEFGQFLSKHSKVSKIYALIGSLREKYVIFDLKKYRGVIFYDTRECPKFEEKRACGLDNKMRNLTNFHQSTWNWDSKLGLLWGTFIPSRKYMSLKFTGVLCVMTMNKGAKFEKESTSSKLTWGI